jgi:hypothetical protein
MSRPHALQLVFIWPHEISLARSGALRLGSLLGPTTTALHLSPLEGSIALTGPEAFDVQPLTTLHSASIPTPPGMTRATKF